MKRERDLSRMMELMERDHGGCEEENCSMRQMMDDPHTPIERMAHWWACSGAACDEFMKLYTKHESYIERFMREGA